LGLFVLVMLLVLAVGAVGAVATPSMGAWTQALQAEGPLGSVSKAQARRERGWQTNCTAPCTIVDAVNVTETCAIPSMRSFGSGDAIVERAAAIRNGAFTTSCPELAGKVLRVRSYVRDGFWVRGHLMLAQATWATLVGIPFFVSLHVNATCTRGSDGLCDTYEDLSPGVVNGDGWEHYFEPIGGMPASLWHTNVSEAKIIELSETQATELGYGRLVAAEGTIGHVDNGLYALVDPDQPMAFTGMMYTADNNQAREDRTWTAPRVAAWVNVQPSLRQRLDEQWERFILPAGRSLGDTRPPIVLGAQIRGTDSNRAVRLESYFVLIDQFIEAHEACGPACTTSACCMRVIVLVATEDQGFLNRTTARYGARVALQNGGDIQRSEGDGIWERGTASGALRLGEEVVVDTLLLSRCDYLLRPQSAVSEWAIYYNPHLINNSWTLTVNPNAPITGASVNPPRPDWMRQDVNNETGCIESCIPGANARYSPGTRSARAL